MDFFRGIDCGLFTLWCIRIKNAYLPDRCCSCVDRFDETCGCAKKLFESPGIIQVIMPLKEVPLRVGEEPLPEAIAQWLVAGRARIERYWDQFPQKPLPQYIECDFDYVSQALRQCVRSGWIDGRLFCEWGCGFGIVTGVAALLGLDAIGIEAEPFLCEEARRLMAVNGIGAEIWQGNFLPAGAASLADDTDPLVSLTHTIAPAYGKHDMQMSDFALIFVYPWPGEEHFLRAVFHRYARPGALMLQFRGPYHVELYRKTQ